MAYDLSSIYSTTNSLSKTILEQLMANNRYSTAAKIVLPYNYSAGSSNSTPIGYSETGRPIFDQSVSATMNDDLKAAIERSHARNSDTMLKGIGTNVAENTSTGNIMAFISKGVIKAFVTEDGRFTGKIRLENIEDLNSLVLDTSRFYAKVDVDNLLSAKISKAALFNASNKISSDFLDADVVLHKVYDLHNNDDVRHITADERTKWTNRYLKPVGGIPMTDLSTAVSDRINASALSMDLTSHTTTSSIHTSTTERTKWNAKYDKPATGIPMTDLSEIVQNSMNSAAKQADLTAHRDNEIKHITGEERTKWNAKYDKPVGGIPFNHLEESVQDTLDASATSADLTAHSNDSVKHVTNAERISWNGRYTKPATGVPIADLDSSLQTAINTRASKDEVTQHVSNTTVHITASERTDWNSHAADGVKHIAAEERTKWNAKYDKPTNGIPEDDLSASLQSKLNSKSDASDFTSHITDSVKHVTTSDRAGWGNKYDKPVNGIPEKDLHSDLTTKINAAATNDALNNHSVDGIKHLTSAERVTWNAKYEKPAAGVPESDLTQGLRDKLASYATSLQVAAHATDVVKHITADERIAWTGKYAKPSTGVPLADLEIGVRTAITASVSTDTFQLHKDNVGAHVTAELKNEWSAKYSKPVTGIPETDLDAQVRNKLAGAVTNTDFNDHATDTTKHVTASERASWNGKYSRSASGIPMEHLAVVIQDKLNNAATSAALTAHVGSDTVHASVLEKSNWNGKYAKPVNGIPTVDLAADIRKVLDDATTHKADGDLHVTVAQKTEWSAKYAKPSTGVPLADLAIDVTGLLDSAAIHAKDGVAHITSAERSGWNAKYNKPVNGIPAIDLASVVATDINDAKVHVGTTALHVSANDRTSWNGKYAKPVSGIPMTDLETSVKTKIEHADNASAHVSSGDRTKWDGSYTKPVTGIPATDLEAAVKAKLDTIKSKYVKSVATDAVTVSVMGNEHGVAHDYGYEYQVSAFKLNGSDWEMVQPTLVRISDTTKDIEVQFAAAFSGKIVIR